MPASATSDVSSSPPPRRRLIILGSTGSIGVNTLDVVQHLGDRGLMHFDVMGLAAGANVPLVCEQARRFNIQHVAVSDTSRCDQVNRQYIKHLYCGPNAALELVQAIAQPGDLVVGAMVGAAGIPATIAAIERGCDIALANKETLVAAGMLVMPLAARHGVNILPVDSEHSAIFQCLETTREQKQGIKASGHQGILNSSTPQFHDVSMHRRIDASSRATGNASSIKRLIITASGGPFRTWTRERTYHATVEEALNHPTWTMGRKVTIDSASLMNKALEIIEAHWLFGLPADRIDVIVHPQSLVHSFVEFVDGSTLAQLSPPDMKTPIQYALTWPHRVPGISRSMDWAALRSMEFEPVDQERFIAPSLARLVIERTAHADEGTSGAIFNAANEAAVQAFENGLIPFGRIAELVRDCLDALQAGPVRTMDDVISADSQARQWVLRQIDRGGAVTRRPAVECSAPSAVHSAMMGAR